MPAAGTGFLEGQIALAVLTYVRGGLNIHVLYSPVVLIGDYRDADC